MTTDLTLIDVGALLDPRTGAMTEGQSLVVRDGRIWDVLSPGAPRPDPGSVQRIDLCGLTVLPGLIDTHAHLIAASSTSNCAAGSRKVEQSGRACSAPAP